MKTLYVFKVKKPVVTESTSKDEDGNEIIKKVTQNQDIPVYIKKPSRREIDEMDLFYSIQISDLQSKGIATNTMILNSYQDSGGIDSKKEVEAMKKLLQDLNTKKNKLYKNLTDKIDDPALLEEIKDMTLEVQEYQAKLASIFDRSAESIAERKLVLWSILFLLFFEENGSYKNICSGSSFNDRLEKYYEIFDSEEDEFLPEKRALEKGQILLSYWLKKQVEKEEDFKLLESILDQDENESEIENEEKDS